MFRNLLMEIAGSHMLKKDLATQLGISVKALGNKLNGKNEFTRKEMICICKLFSRSMSYLFDDDATDTDESA